MGKPLDWGMTVSRPWVALMQNKCRKYFVFKNKSNFTDFKTPFLVSLCYNGPKY